MNADRVGSIFWLAVGLVSAYGALQLGFGKWQEPGGGFLPFLAASFVTLMAFIVFVQSFIPGRNPEKKLSALWENVNWRRPLYITIIIIVFIFALEHVGFLLTNFLLLFFLFKKVEKLSWSKAVVYPALTVGISYVLFHILLKSTLPRGFLGF